jgi:GTPase SAR1 family protein
MIEKSLKVSKKKLHQRKIVPVIIWDFGGQDVFYSTHQTFLTYRAIYMLVLDGSRTLEIDFKLLIILGFLTKLAALGTDTSLFSGSCSDDCPNLLSVPVVVRTDTSLFSV